MEVAESKKSMKFFFKRSRVEQRQQCSAVAQCTIQLMLEARLLMILEIKSVV